MNKEIFEKELAMCQKLSKENDGKCHWGECEKCGVILLLYKLYKGKVIEDKEEMEIIRKSVFG